MIYSPETAYAQLVEANPAPVVPVDRPSAQDFLKAIEEETPFVAPPTRRPRRQRPEVAVVAFIVVLLIGAVTLLLVSSDEQIVDEPSTTTTVFSTTTTVSVPLSEALAVAQELAVAYSAGDFADLEALLAEGTSYSWSRSSDFVAGPVIWTREEFEARYQIDVALNTTIELVDCQEFSESRVSCAILRHDDLVRAQRIDPSPDVRWRLTVEDGLVVDWVHFTPDISDYFLFARDPFHTWFLDAYPDLTPPFTDLCGQPWKWDTDFATIASDLVAEYVAAGAPVGPSGCSQ